jgi:hypothetical protein
MENPLGSSSRRLSLGEKLAERAGVRLDGKLTEEKRARRAKLLQAEQVRLAELQSKIKIANEICPELRLQMLPAYIPLDIETCHKHYGKYQLMRFDKDAANKIAGLLTSFQREHPWEWEYSGWKNDAMAELMLGRLNSSLRTVKYRGEVGQRWLKEYWQREGKRERETETYLGAKRMAASAAVFEVEMLKGQDKPRPWMRPGYGDYARFVRWLNKNLAKLASKKKGAALLEAVVDGFRCAKPKTELSESIVVEIWEAYNKVELRYAQGSVSPYNVILNVVARRHNVSERLVTTVRAENNQLHSQTSKKAR